MRPPSLTHPLKRYLTDVQEPIADFGARVGASRQTLYRILGGKQTPKPALARRIVEATGGAVPFEALYPGAAGRVAALPRAESAPLELSRLKLALAIVTQHLTPSENAPPPDQALMLAAEAAAHTYAALAPVTTRTGLARLAQALRPVLEEILRDYGSAPPPSALDRGAELAAQLYQSHLFPPPADDR